MPRVASTTPVPAPPPMAAPLAAPPPPPTMPPMIAPRAGAARRSSSRPSSSSPARAREIVAVLIGVASAVARQIDLGEAERDRARALSPCRTARRSSRGRARPCPGRQHLDAVDASPRGAACARTGSSTWLVSEPTGVRELDRQRSSRRHRDLAVLRLAVEHLRSGLAASAVAARWSPPVATASRPGAASAALGGLRAQSSTICDRGTCIFAPSRVSTTICSGLHLDEPSGDADAVASSGRSRRCPSGFRAISRARAAARQPSTSTSSLIHSFDSRLVAMYHAPGRPRLCNRTSNPSGRPQTLTRFDRESPASRSGKLTMLR